MMNYAILYQFLFILTFISIYTIILYKKIKWVVISRYNPMGLYISLYSKLIFD